MIEPGQDRTIGPEPAPPAPQTEVTEIVGSHEPVEENTPVETVEEPDVFDRDYVEKLRRENAKWRTQAQEYNEVFGDLDDEDKAAWFQIVQLANQGDPEALQYLGQALGFVPDETPAEEPVDQPQYLTAEQAREIARQETQELLAQQEQVRSQAQQIETIQSRAKNDFGIEPGSDDYVLLLHRANQIDPNETPDGDLLAAAHAQLQAEKQAQWDQFIASKEGEAANSPTTLTGAGVAPSTAKLPYDSNMTMNEKFAAVRNSLHERLSNQG